MTNGPSIPPRATVTNERAPLSSATLIESSPVGGTVLELPVMATVFPPISGQKSALIVRPGSAMPPTPRFTARLAVAPGNSVVRFSVRQFSTASTLSADRFGSHARIAVPGGAIVDVPLGNNLLSSIGNETTDTGVRSRSGRLLGSRLRCPPVSATRSYSTFAPASTMARAVGRPCWRRATSSTICASSSRPKGQPLMKPLSATDSHA